MPTLDGAVDLAVPAGTSSGRTFRLKGKGLVAKRGTGDLLVSVRIVLPEKSDPELDELMRKWRDEKPYDPRKGTGKPRCRRRRVLGGPPRSCGALSYAACRCRLT